MRVTHSDSFLNHYITIRHSAPYSTQLSQLYKWAMDSLKKSKSGHEGHMTRLYSDLETQMVSVDNLETVQNLFGKLCHQVEQYKSVHLEIIGRNEDPSALSEMEAKYDSALKNFAEFKTRMDEYVAKENEHNTSSARRWRPRRVALPSPSYEMRNSNALEPSYVRGNWRKHWN